MSKETKNKIVPMLRFPEFGDREWNMKKLENILLEAKLGGNYENSVVNKGIPVIKMGNLDRGNINVERIQYLLADSEYLEADILKEGDLLFNTRNTLELVGKVAIWKGELPTAVYNSNLLRLTFHQEIVSSNYFMNYCFNTTNVIAAIREIATGTTSVAAIYTRDLLKLTLPIPSINEQKKIAHCLSSLDDLITVQIQKLEALKTHKKGLMQQLFPAEGETVPKLRFAEFEDGEGWGKKEFNDILEITRLAGYEYSEYWEEDPNKEIIALRGYNIGQGKLELNNLGYISNNLSLKLIRSRLFKGNIVYPCVGTIGNATVIEEDNRYHIQQNIAKLTPKNRVSPYFVSQFLMSDLGMREVYRFNATSSQPNVLVGSLRKFKIQIPDFEEQEKIAECLSSLDELITAQTEEIEALKLHKKGLIQGLFPSIN